MADDIGGDEQFELPDDELNEAENIYYLGSGSLEWEIPSELGNPLLSYLDMSGLWIPFQTPPATVADFIPDDGTATIDSQGIWTDNLLRGWPVRYG